MNAPVPDRFVTTRWTEVLAACGSSDTGRSALQTLCAAYYGPVVAYLTRTGVGNEEPREVAHAFFARLLEGEGLAGVDPKRGRFRSYLLGALKHFVANRRLHAAREKRGGGVEHAPLATGTEDGTAWEVAAETPALDALFDHEWAVTVVESALAQLEREAEVGGTRAQFDVLKAWLSLAAEPGSQAEAAARLGTTEGAVKVAIHRLRRRFREQVRTEVAQTLPAGESVDEELRHLMAALEA